MTEGAAWPGADGWGPLPYRRFAPAAKGTAPFWDAVAQVIGQSAQQVAGSWAILVPHGRCVPGLQQALRSRLAQPGRPWVPPAVRTLAGWLDGLVPGAEPDVWALTLAVHRVLDEALPDGARRAPAERLVWAQGLAQVLLVWASHDAAAQWSHPIEVAQWAQRWGLPTASLSIMEDLALLRRLAEALDADLQAALQQHRRRVEGAVRVWAKRAGRLWLLAWHKPGPQERLLWDACAQIMPPGHAMVLAPDWAALGQQVPVLAAAWPEAVGAPVGDLVRRRKAWQSRPQGTVPQCLHAHDRETEAQCAAQWVLDRFAAAQRAQQPVPRVALLAVDRWLARRVRALLERAAVALDDREGWLVSTTVAASAVLGWLDVVAHEAQHDDMRAWLEGRFIKLEEQSSLLDWVEQAATRRGFVRGWSALLAATAPATAPSALARLHECARAQRLTQSLHAHVHALDALLRLADAPRRLSADAAGRQVLGLLERLRATAGRVEPSAVMSFGEFRAVCRLAFEQHRFFDSVDSPLVVTALHEAVGGEFDAVLILGAAAGSLPAPPPALPWVNESVRAALGLPTGADWALGQQHDVLLLCAMTTQVAVTCRTDVSDGTAPSPWLERLQWIVAADPIADPWGDRGALPGQVFSVAASPLRQPALSLAWEPRRLTVAGIARLVQCPYDFLVRDGWGLAEMPEVVDAPGARERGNLVHEILFKWHSQLAAAETRAPSDRAQLLASLRAVTQGVAERELAHGGAVLAQLAEWQVLLEPYLDWWLSDVPAGWQWQMGEEKTVLELPELRGAAGRLRIEGRFDRLDRGPCGWRLLDYKLGTAKPLRADVQAPERAVQLGLYAWMVSQTHELVEAGYLSLRRDGVQWLGLAHPVTDVVAYWQTALPQTLEPVLQGAPLAASGQSCARCASRGICRKGHWA